MTPDGRYFVVRGRLWRMANRKLDEVKRADLVGRLMGARRAVRSAKKAADPEAADELKQALGKRGPAGDSSSFGQNSLAHVLPAIYRKR